MALKLIAVSPAALGVGNNNDYAGVASSSFARLAADALGSTLTGLAAGTDGYFIIIVNVSGNTLTIAHEDANSAAANRFITATGLAVVMAQHDAAFFCYDGVTARWRQVTLVA